MNEEFKPYRTDKILGDFYKHPTFGTIAFSRGQGASRPLFGSSVLHNQIIRLEVSRAELSRNLNSDHIFNRDTIVEVEMSPTQFADAITGLNCGSGIPVTIRYVAQNSAEKLWHTDPPYQNKVEQFNQEFKDDINNLSKEFDTVIALAKETKAQVRLVRALEMLKQGFKSNIPFVNQQFSEQMDKTVTEAKGEVEAFVNHMVQSYGIEAIRKQSPQLPAVDGQAKELPQGRNDK